MKYEYARLYQASCADGRFPRIYGGERALRHIHTDYPKL